MRWVVVLCALAVCFSGIIVSWQQSPPQDCAELAEARSEIASLKKQIDQLIPPREVKTPPAYVTAPAAGDLWSARPIESQRPKTVQVRSYVRSNGTRVESYKRSAPRR